MSPVQYLDGYDFRKLKALRESKGVSLGRLRDDVMLMTHGKYRFHPQTLERYEKPPEEGGRILPYERAILLAQYFGVGIEAFCNEPTGIKGSL